MDASAREHAAWQSADATGATSRRTAVAIATRRLAPMIGLKAFRTSAQRQSISRSIHAHGPPPGPAKGVDGMILCDLE
jgi:hypothetical protein